LRRLNFVCVAAVACLALVSCKRKHEVESASESVTVAPLKSAIEMNDPAAASQLANGFHGIEGGSWRWTARSFSIVLQTPQGSAQNGAKLHFKFTFPDAVFSKVGALQLTASIDGMALGSEQYTKPGNYEYTRDVPPNMLSKPAVRVEFACDKALEPSGGDVRELALIAVSAGLEAQAAAAP